MEGWRSRKYFAAAVPRLIFCWAPVYYNPLLRALTISGWQLDGRGWQRFVGVAAKAVVSVG